MPNCHFNKVALQPLFLDLVIKLCWKRRLMFLDLYSVIISFHSRRITCLRVF